MNKYKILKCMMPVILTAVLLMQSAFLPVTRIQTEAVTPDMSIINESERGHVEAWNPVYGRNITVYADGHVYSQPELMDFTYEDGRPGGVIYCIQPGADISSGDGLEAASFDETYPLLTDTQIENIQRVTGYMDYEVEYQNGQTENNIKALNYYWTYQCLLWYYCGAMTDSDVERTMNANGVGDYLEYVRIQSLMEEYDTIPSYSVDDESAIDRAHTYRLTSNGDGTYSKIIHDTTGMLKNGRMEMVTTDSDKVIITQCNADGTPSESGEYIKLTATSCIDADTPVICSQKKKAEYSPYCMNNILLYNGRDDHQNCLSLGIADYSKVGGYFSVYTEGYGRIVLIKTSSTGKVGGDATLANAVYDVYATCNLTWNGKTYTQGSIVGSIVTDAEGYGCLDRIPIATYLVCERNAPSGFYVDAKAHKAICDEGISFSESSEEAGCKEVVVRSVETPILTDYIISKKTLEHGMKGDLLVPFTNCRFSIYLLSDIPEKEYTRDSKGQYEFSKNAFKGVKPVQQKVTDSTGRAEFKNLYYGSYVIRETEAGDRQHRLIAPYVVTLPVRNGDGTYAGAVTKTLIDDWVTARISMVKYDELTGERIRIGRATYKLKDTTANKYLYLKMYSEKEDKIISTDTFTSDENGEFYFVDEIPAGQYIWEEQDTEAISCYGLSDVEMLIEDGRTLYRPLDAEGKPMSEEYTEADIVNDESGAELYVIKAVDKPHQVSVMKVDENGKTLKGALLGIALPGEKGPLTDEEGKYKLLELPVVKDGTLICDENGKAYVEEAKWLSEETYRVNYYLPTGDYYLVELEPPQGYVSAEPIMFSVGNEVEEVIIQGETKQIDHSNLEIEMTDREIDVQITKKDIVTGEELSGAKLRVTDAGGNPVDEWISSDTPHQIPAHLLQVGKTYTLTEVMAPENYFSANSITFTVNDVPVTQNIVMYDEPAVGRIYILKTGEYLISAEEKETEYGNYLEMKYNQKPLANVEFTVYNQEDVAVDVMVTRQDGRAESSKLPWGDYYLMETRVPDGYVPKADKIPVHVGEDSFVESISEPLGITNQLSTARLHLYKVGEVKRVADGITEIKKEPLQGAVFGLYAGETYRDYEGTTVVNKDSCLGYLITDKAGVATYEGKLPEGSYYYKEVAAPKNYVRSNQIFEFELKLGDSEKTIIELNKDNPIVNYLERDEIVLPEEDPFPETGDKSIYLLISILFAISGFIFLILTTIYLRREKYISSKNN